MVVEPNSNLIIDLNLNLHLNLDLNLNLNLYLNLNLKFAMDYRRIKFKLLLYRMQNVALDKMESPSIIRVSTFYFRLFTFYLTLIPDHNPDSQWNNLELHRCMAERFAIGFEI